MKKSKILKFSILLIIFLLMLYNLFLFTSCKKKVISKNIIIYTALEPIKFIFDFLVEKKIEVRTLINKNLDPHTFEITPKEVEMLNNSLAYLSINLPFEKYIIENVSKNNNNIKIIDISKDIKLIKSFHSHHHNDDEEIDKNSEKDNEEIDYDDNINEFDIHIWVSLINLKIISKNIFEFIINNLPQFKETTKKNYEKLILYFDEYYKKFEKLINEKNIKKIMVYHPSFTYFCEDFNIEQIVIEIEGKEPTIKNLKNFFDIAKNNKIKVFYTSPQFPTIYTEIFKKELNLEIYEINILSYNIFEIFDTLYFSLEKYY